MNHPEAQANKLWRPASATLAILILTLLCHLLVVGQVDLSVDEAHYALYGLIPDWSYFDHPPLVGWLQALVLQLGESEFVLRLWPLIATIAATGLMYRLTREIFPSASPWAPAVAVALLHSALIFQLLGIAMVPEVPLLVLGLATSLLLWRASASNRWGDWLLLGVCLGLAGLSKYTAVTLALGTVVFLLWQSGWRSLFNPRLWTAAMIALLMITPVLYWNAQHDWISFYYQLGHGLPERGWDVQRFATAIIGQLLAYGPVVVIFGVMAFWRGCAECGAGERLTISMAAPLFLLIFWGAGFEETLPHWTLVGWALLAPLTAVWVSKHYRNRRWVTVTSWLGGAYSLLLFLLVHGMLLQPGLVPFSPYRHPLGDLLGWREAAQRAVTLQHQAMAGRLKLYVGNWVMGSRIAWYGRPAGVKVADERYDQFDIWYGSPQPEDTALLIVPDYLEGRGAVNGLARFKRCDQHDQWVYSLGDTPVHRFTYYICTGYHG